MLHHLDWFRLVVDLIGRKDAFVHRAGVAGDPEAGVSIGGVLVLVAWLASVWWAWRRRHRTLLALHAVIAELDLGPVVAIGQSLRGAVAVLLAAEHPDDVAGLVLLDPTPITDPQLAAMVEKRAQQAVGLFRMPVVGGILRRSLKRSAEKSAKRHRMTPEVRAAMLKITDLDAAQLGRAVDRLADLGAQIDLTALPRVPAVVVTADRKPKDRIRRAHARLAEALGAELVTWPTAEHAVHVTHPDEVLEESRAIVRQVAAAAR